MEALPHAKNFTTQLRRWTIVIRHHVSGELIAHQFHLTHFPSGEDCAREALCQVAPQGLPVLMGDESLTELLAARGFSVVWVQEEPSDPGGQATLPMSALKGERLQD